MNADNTFTMTSHLAFMGLSQPTGFFLPSGHGVWKNKGRRSIATTVYFFVPSAVGAGPPPGLLYVTLAIPCHLTVDRNDLAGDCNVKFCAPVDAEDGIPNSPYPPTSESFMSVLSNLDCSRLPGMKMKP